MGSISDAPPIHSSLVPPKSRYDTESEERHKYQDAEKVSQCILLPLKSVCLPKVHPRHHFNLADQGWTTITYDKPADRLFDSFRTLLRASEAFFELPEPTKQAFKTDLGSEEGWSSIEGEKEFITMRSLDNAPEDLVRAALAFWAEAGSLLNEMLGRIAHSLGLAEEALTIYSSPCKRLLQEKTATMLRLFRYEGSTEPESKVVAEAHKDLGLLSLVIGDSPGLEVWDRHFQRWFPLEQSFTQPSACVLVGRQLERLSNGRYRAGGHLVRSYPCQTIPQPDAREFRELNGSRPTYRHSVVFVLRAHSPVPIDTDNLTTSITGPFRNPLRGVTAGDLFKDIRNAHFNINTTKQERDTQRKKLAGKKEFLPSPT